MQESNQEFTLTDSPRTGDSAATAASQSGSPDAVAAQDEHQKAYAANKPRTAAEANTKVSEEIARRAGRGDDAEPLGDPNAPQGSGPETDMSQPHNRPAPLGKIRMSHMEGGPDHEQ